MASEPGRNTATDENLMGVQLDVRPCWKWVCPHCDRVFRYPTTKSMKEAGTAIVASHLFSIHGISPYENVSVPVWMRGWEKDHYATLVAPCG